ncbi:transcriptional repressor NrdR [bacterium]|nr:transcriptional repressor NrdR [bacterium]
MKCPYCGEDNDKVVDSRSMMEGNSIRRRRECLSCNNRFTTYEQIDSIPLMVIKRDKRREPFNPQKLAHSMRIACQKRPVSEERIEELTRKIEMKLTSLMKKEIESELIGEMVMSELRGLDQIAYVRFASVYRDFKAVEEFIAEASELLTKPSPSS